jgi:hypothetical protein
MPIILKSALAYPRQVELDVLSYDHVGFVESILEKFERKVVRLFDTVIVAVVVNVGFAKPFISVRNHRVAEVGQGCRSPVRFLTMGSFDIKGQD